MTVSDAEFDRLTAEWEDAREAREKAKQEYHREVGRKDELKRQEERAKAEEERVRGEAAANALLAEAGSGTAVDSGVKKRLQQIQGKRSELETRIETKKRAWEEAQERARRAALELTRAIRERRQRAAAEFRQSFEPLGEAVIDYYLEHLAAQDRLTALDRDLSHMVGQATASPNQRARLRASIERGDRDLSGSALLGWCVVEALRWARRFEDGPLGEYLREEGVPTIEGSPRHGNPFGALEDVVAAIESGRIPGGTSRV